MAMIASFNEEESLSFSFLKGIVQESCEKVQSILRLIVGNHVTSSEDVDISQVSKCTNRSSLVSRHSPSSVGSAVKPRLSGPVQSLQSCTSTKAEKKKREQ